MLCQGHNRRERAGDGEVQPIAFGTRRCFDAVDQRADRFAGGDGFDLRPAQRLGQIPDLAAVDLGDGRVRGHHRLGTELGEFGRRTIASLRRDLHSRAQFGQCSPTIGNRIDQPVDLPLGASMGALKPSARVTALASIKRGHTFPFVEPRHHQIGVQQPITHRAEHPALKLHRRDRAPVIAIAPLDGATAPPAVIAEHGKAAAAQPAPHEPRQQQLRPDPPRHRLLSHRLDMRLRCREPIARDDRQFGHVGGLPLGGRVRPRDSLARLRVFLEPLAIIDDPPVVERIVQDPGAPARVAIDRRRAPFAAVRARHAVAVELLRNRARAAAGKKFVEDAPHDRGVLGDDLAPPAIGLAAIVERDDLAIAIGQPAGDPAHLDTAELAAPRLFAELLEIERRDRAAQADVQLAHVAFGKRHQPHTGEAQPLPDVGDILLIAADPVDRFGEHHVDPVEHPEQRVQPRPVARRARQREIGIDAGYRPALGVGALLAQSCLIFSRSLVLLVA